MGDAVKRTGRRAHCAACVSADSTHRASHGSRIVALGPCLSVATTTPLSVMSTVKVGNDGVPKKVASTFPSGVSNRINVGARELTMNPVVESSTSAVYCRARGPLTKMRRSGSAGPAIVLSVPPACTDTVPKGALVDWSSCTVPPLIVSRLSRLLLVVVLVATIRAVDDGLLQIMTLSGVLP